MKRIYLSPPHVSEEERSLLLEAFDSNWIAPLGPHVDAFEREFADVVGVPYGAALTSGTAALHLALMLIGVGPGDEVITSSLTFAATANAIAYRGARPVFIDSDRETWTMDPGLLREELKACAARGRLPKAVLVVDLYGQCADYERIQSACDEFGVPIIEDAAEALGSTYRGRSAGAFGCLSAFSFNGNKIITTSGGGMLVSHRSDWIERARFLATQARDTAPHYQHSEVGYNYRMSNLLAAVGRGQLAHLPSRVRERRANNAFYRAALDLPGVEFMPEAPYGRSNMWLTCVTIDPDEFGADRERVRLHLASLMIECRPVWKPMHLQPAFAQCRARGGDVSKDLFERGLCLPSGSNLTQDERDRVVSAVLEARSPERAARPRPQPVTSVDAPAVAARTPLLAPGRLVPLKRGVLRFRRLLAVGVQLLLVIFANVLAFSFRFDGDVPAWASQAMRSMLPWLVVARGLTFVPFRIYEGLWRYTDLYDLRNMAAAVVTSSAVFWVLIHTPLGPPVYPRSILIVDALMLIFALAGIRLARRFYNELSRPSFGRPVLVVGAGSAGELVVRDMHQNPAHGLRAIGFIDDNPAKLGRRIHGVPVLGGRRDLALILADHRPEEIIVAVPSASAATMRSILRDFEPYRIAIKTLPTLRDLVEGRATVAGIRPLRMEDLLARAPIELASAALGPLVAGRRVLVTGAGGAVGAELSRQIAALEPASLVLFDRSATSLHAVVNSLAGTSAVVPWLGDVADREQVAEVFGLHRPQLVFHAAVQNDAFFLEQTPCEAVRSNVTGTLNIVEASREVGADRVIVLSTIKAVNPATVAAATRRVAELAVGALSEGPMSTTVCCVRLGSVLGRPGSLVPVLREQIHAGGPVMVAHPDVKRYFILPAEAAQLLLHTAAHAEPGATYVLDMGEQIRVLDLARDLIRTEGFVPDEEIQIRFTELEAGERLFDELASATETLTVTQVKQILRVRSTAARSVDEVRAQVATLVMAASRRQTDEVLAALSALVPEFSERPRETALPAVVGAESLEGRIEPSVVNPPIVGRFGMQECPKCRAAAARRSHAQSASDRVWKRFTSERPFVCDACGWRGWMLPANAVAVPSTFPAPPEPDLTALDEAIDSKPRREQSIPLKEIS